MFFWFPTLIISYTLKGIILIKKSCLLLGLHFSWIYEHFLPFWIFRDLRDGGRAIASANWHQKVVDSISFLHDSHYQIPCLIHHKGWCKVSRVMQKSLEVWHMMLPEDKHRAVSFSRTHVSWCREEFNAELEVVQWLFLKLGSIWTYSQISPSHDQNAYIVEYMEEGDFLVLLCGKDTLKSHYTQLFQCRISYYYVAPRVDAPGKMWNNELQIQMAATMDSMVRLSEVSPPQPCNPLPEGLKLHIWHWHCAVGRISCTVLLPGEAHGSK